MKRELRITFSALLVAALLAAPWSALRAQSLFPETTVNNTSGLDVDFGHAVAVSGNYAMVAAPGTYSFSEPTNYVKVYRRFNGAWTEVQTITGTPGSHFGEGIALDGGTALILASVPEFATSPVIVAYVYELNLLGKWSKKHALVTYAFDHDAYVPAVSLWGDAAVIGLPGSGHSGSAVVFRRASGTWSWVATLKSPSGTPGDYFGVSVDVSGDTVLVGAPGAVQPGSKYGAVYDYTFVSGMGSAFYKVTPLPLPTGDFDHYGVAVALDGDTAMTSVATDRVDVYRRSGPGQWMLQDSLITDGQHAARRIALDRDVAIVLDGAVFAASLFERDRGGWSKRAELAGAYAGQWISLAVDGATVLAGSEYTESAYFYDLRQLGR